MEPANAEKLFQEATALAEGGHFGRAAELFEKASKRDPTSAKHHEARAQCLLELEEFDGAVAAAEAALKLSPDWLPGKATFGRALFNAGHLEDALIQFEEAHQMAAKHDVEWAAELAEELKEARELLQRHWAEHHDILLPLRPGGEPLRIRQALDCRYCNISNGELGPGGAVWAAGCILAAQAAELVESLGTRVRLLELGSGTGAGGLAAAAAGAEVVLTDHSNLLTLSRLNTQLNASLLRSSGGSASSCAFDWDAELEDEILRQPFDMVIGADLVYSFAAVEPFVTALQAVLLPRGPAGNALAPGMFYAHFPRFPNLDQAMETAMEARGLEAKERPLPSRTGAVGTIPENALNRVRLLEIRPKSTYEATSRQAAVFRSQPFCAPMAQDKFNKSWGKWAAVEEFST